MWPNFVDLGGFTPGPSLLQVSPGGGGAAQNFPSFYFQGDVRPVPESPEWDLRTERTSIVLKSNLEKNLFRFAQLYSKYANYILSLIDPTDLDTIFFTARVHRYPIDELNRIAKKRRYAMLGFQLSGGLGLSRPLTPWFLTWSVYWYCVLTRYQ